MKRILSLPSILGLIVCFGWLAQLTPAQSATLPMSQREYLKYLVSLTGDCGLLGTSPSDEDYIKWAKKQKMDPKASQKGWSLDAPLTQEVLAETLAQFFDMGKPKKGVDYVRLLAREGITLPETPEITREDFTALVDQVGFQGLTWDIASDKNSPSRPSKKPEKPPMPHKPNPGNHYGWYK